MIYTLILNIIIYSKCCMCMILVITVMESLEYLIHLASKALSDVTTHAHGITKWNQI